MQKNFVSKMTINHSNFDQLVNIKK